jgi:hypothetical protein
MKCIFIGYSDEKKGYRLLSDGKFIVSRDVIFYETESKNFNEINHLLSCLEQKNTKGKGKLKKKPRKPFWFEKDFVSSERQVLHQMVLLNINSFDNEISPIQDSSPAQDTS